MQQSFAFSIVILSLDLQRIQPKQFCFTSDSVCFSDVDTKKKVAPFIGTSIRQKLIAHGTSVMTFPSAPRCPRKSNIGINRVRSSSST